MLQYLHLIHISHKQLQSASEYLKEQVDNLSSPTESSDAMKALTKYMNGMGDKLYTLLYNFSSFASRCSNANSAANSVVWTREPDASGEGELYNLATGERYIILPALNNAEFFQNALRTGSLFLEKFTKDNDNKAGAWTSVNIGACDIIQDKLYTEDDAAAEAEYETQTAIIQSQDKMLDVELRQVETQQKACDNEYESVKKILDKNVERSFKVFS